MEQEEIFEFYIYDKNLKFRIYKKLLQLNQR